VLTFFYFAVSLPEKSNTNGSERGQQSPKETEGVRLLRQAQSSGFNPKGRNICKNLDQGT